MGTPYHFSQLNPAHVGGTHMMTARMETPSGGSIVTCGNTTLEFGPEVDPMRAHALTHASWALEAGKKVVSSVALDYLLCTIPAPIEQRVREGIDRLMGQEQFRGMCLSGAEIDDMIDSAYPKVENQVVGACVDGGDSGPRLIGVLDWFGGLWAPGAKNCRSPFIELLAEAIILSVSDPKGSHIFTKTTSS